MATTKLSQEVLDFNPGNPDYVLDSTNAVTVINAGGNQYNFNGVYGKFGAKIGTITLTGVPAGHPIAFINSGKTSQISYTGTVDEGTATGPDGNTYTFYSGTVTLTVSADFGTISYYCKIHGYMGGQDNLVYTYSDSGLKIPSGTELNRPTAVAGMVRNNTNESSDSSNSCEEYYNGSAWQKINNVAIPVDFGIALYNGNSSTNNITGLGFAPDWVWIKERGPSSEQSNIYDTTRGVQKFLVSNTNAAEVSGSSNRLNAFGSDGFTVGSDNEINDSGSTYVAWCWKANGGTTSSNGDGDITSTVQVNAGAGFSIITYQNNGSGSARVGHGLGTTPKIVIIKKYSVAAAWHFMTTQIDGSFDDFILNDTSTKTDSSLTAPNDTTFAAESGAFGQDMICYAFAEISGYSKFGTYSGTGSSNPITGLGFQPSWVMLKCTTATEDWAIFDASRGPNLFLTANTTSADQSFSGFSFDSDGFTVPATSGMTNGSGQTYIYMAFK